ncbi:SET and MYND domain-containing protein 4 isoform X1 [Hemitrygon akajei]|uniref:SET and MYND domain-containing protein 4 isoform X1 n=1 Tax=Hemitrygon akajei TaxID=2704970 RepID=UPI003BFA38CA
MAGASAEWRRVCGVRWRATPDSERRRFGSVTDPGRVFDLGRRWLVDEDVAALNALSAQWWAQKDVKTAQDLKCRGNECFKARDYLQALALYSQGLRHSTADCPETALLYANRSAALFHLQRYQECLEEIDRAEQHSYPPELQHKLWDRQAACLQRLDRFKEGPRVPEAQTPLSGEVEPDSPPSISLQWDVTRGRHYTAARDLQPGEVVLQEEAFATVLVSGGQPSTQDLYCHLCLRPTDLPLPCPHCSFSSYCRESCRQQAWHLYHWLDCPFTGLLLTLGPFVHLALRTVLTAGLAEVERLQVMDTPGQEKGRGPQKATPYQTIHSLLTHSGARPPEHQFLCALSAAALCQAVRESGCGARLGIVAEAEGEDGARSLKTLGVAVLRHMLQLECNGQAITAITDTGMGCERVVETRQVRIATALYARASLFNHSCDPNTSISFHGTSIIFRATQHIPVGQEVLHCYGPHWRRLAVRERQQALMSQYVFQCHCDACVREEAEGSTSLTAPFLCQHCGSVLTRLEGPQYKCSADTCGHSEPKQHLCQQLGELMGRVRGASDLISAQPETALPLLLQCRVEARRLLSDRHSLRGEIEDSLAQVYALQGDWQAAARHLKESGLVVRLQYGSQSIELAHQLFKLAQILFNSQLVEEALGVIEEAEPLLSTHYGPEHEMVMELKEMMSYLRGLSDGADSHLLLPQEWIQ